MRWNAAIVEMDRYYKTMCTDMGIEIFCNLVEESIHELHFLRTYYGDETKMRRVNLVVEIFITIFPFFITFT
jgi:hypothetical protein